MGYAKVSYRKVLKQGSRIWTLKSIILPPTRYPPKIFAIICWLFCKPNGTAEDLIVTQENCTYRAMIDDLINSAKIQPYSLIEINNNQVIKQLVMSGLGITILPRVSVESEINQGYLLLK
ncbi:MAG TPA: hypothetical protein DDW65_24575 [Firmicutes bacterium]|jgi:hypothetical protein|nr:hypothetical protein [Bacillota bacterium]